MLIDEAFKIAKAENLDFLTLCTVKPRYSEIYKRKAGAKTYAELSKAGMMFTRMYIDLKPHSSNASAKAISTAPL